MYPKYVSGSFCVHYSSTYYSSGGNSIRKKGEKQVSIWYKFLWLHIQSISRKSIYAFCTEKPQKSSFDDTCISLLLESRGKNEERR